MNAKKPRTPCRVCGNEPAGASYKYCSNICQQEFQYRRYIEEWKAGKRLGLQKQGTVSPSIKRYLREKYHDQCCICGWAQINPLTNKVPLVADHIDGNWQNNIESNLRLICPNCDALNPTYAALNKGKGRQNRPPDKRAAMARGFIESSRKEK